MQQFKKNKIGKLMRKENLIIKEEDRHGLKQKEQNKLNQ